jgi:hypothetical protein
MLAAELLRASLVTVNADEKFTQAVMQFRDGSRLLFCHRVDERWAKALAAEQHAEESGQAGIAGQLLAAMTIFRLNAKHLDVQFLDGSRWDEPVRSGPTGTSAQESSDLS